MTSEPTTLDEVLAAVVGRVSYLRATSSPEGVDWVAAGEIVDDRANLTAIVEGTLTGFGTDDVSVAASLFTQAYAFRVASVVLGAYAMGIPVPDVRPAAMALRIDKPRPSAVAFLEPGVARLDAASMTTALVAGHLAPFIAAAHKSFRVGERLLWGNAAASCAVVFRAVEGESGGGERDTVRARADDFMRESDPWFAGLGGFETIAHAGREGWYWNRTNCCLWYRTRSDQLCDNCSLIPADELQTRRLHELEGQPG